MLAKSCIYSVTAWAISWMVGTPIGCAEENDQWREASSMLEAVLLNNDSLRNYDVLIRHESISDPGPGDWVHGYRAQTIYMRMRVDWDAKRLLFALAMKTNTVANGESKVTEYRAGGGIREGDKAFELQGSGIARYRMTFRELLMRFDIPDIRMVGFNTFPAYFAPEGELGIKTLVEVVSSGAKNITMTSRGATTTVTRKIPARGMEEVWANVIGITSWTFSDRSPMPTQWEVTLRGGTGAARKSVLLSREHFEWQERNAVYVPIRIIGAFRESDYKKNGGEGDRKPQPFESERTTHFHWFSVNEPLPEEAFDSSLIEQPAEFQKLIDPTLSHAESLQGL